MHPYTHNSIIHNGHDMENLRSTDGWMDKENVIHITMECYSAIERMK